MLGLVSGTVDVAAERLRNPRSSLFAPAFARSASVRKRIHRKHPAERPGRGAKTKHQTQNGVPAFLPSIRNGGWRSSVAIALSRRVHPNTDCDPKQRGECPNSGRPDDDSTPLEAMLAERGEVQP